MRGQRRKIAYELWIPLFGIIIMTLLKEYHRWLVSGPIKEQERDCSVLVW